MEVKTNASVEKQAEEIKQIDNTTAHKTRIGTYIFIALACIVLYILVKLQVFNINAKYTKIVARLCLAAFFTFTILIISNVIEYLIAKRGHGKAIQYNLVRAIRLVSFVIIIFIIISFINANWYTAAVSLGLISLILGFALQTPIASLIGWFYIILRTPYKVGDRIQVTTFTGDVVEIGYLDTTLWEFAGNYMTNDLPSGRLIRFPNSMVFQSQVYNYSWNKFPYIWNEIPFHIAYDADLAFVEQTIRDVAKAELGSTMEERVKEFKHLLKQTPVDELEIKEYPFVSFRINSNTWVEVLLIYLVEPKHSSAMRSTLIKKILAALVLQPDNVKYPKGDSR